MSSLSYTLGALVVFAYFLRNRQPLLYYKENRSIDTTLGVANSGIHRYKFFDIAIIDFLGLLCIAVICAQISKGSTLAWMTFIWVISEIQHHYGGIPTSTQKWFFGYK